MVRSANADVITHKMKREYLSLCYTTKFSDILEVRI